MRTKIVNYGMDNELFGSGMGTYDEHDNDSKAGQGVYGREDMMRFISIVTKHFLTEKQRQYYFSCVVYGESPMKIARQEGVHISNVYKHLKKAKMTISNIKELMAYAGGKKSTFVLFQQIISDFGRKKKSIATDFYINGITAMQIADKNETDFISIKNYINAIRKKLTSKGITEDDLKFIRYYYKKQRSVSNGSNGN